MERSGSKETACLHTVLIISSVSLGAVSGYVKNSGTAAFINAFLTVVIALFALVIADKMLGDKDLLGAMDKVYGKALSSILMCVIFAITLISASQRMSINIDALQRYVLQDTPRMAITLVFGLCVFFATYFGFEAITRYGFATLVVFVSLLALILLSSSAEINYLNICPMLGKGDFSGVFGMMYVFADVFYVYVMRKSLSPKGSKAARYAVIIGGTIAVIVALFYTLCVPYPVSVAHPYPLYTLASLSNTSVIFQRLDGLVFIIWIFSGFLSVGALSFFASYIFKEVFSLEDRRPIAAPVTVAVVTLSGIVHGEFLNSIMSVLCFLFLPITAILYRLFWRKKDV